MRLLETTLAISTLSLFLALSSALQDAPPRKPTKSPLAREPMQALVDEMQGAWRLVKIESPTLEELRRQDVGFMLVTGNYFSFELHLGWKTASGLATRIYFQSGTHRFEIDAYSRMTASSVIGSQMDDAGRVLFEQPGRKREYTVECTAGYLKLKRDDGMKLEFERMADVKPKRDFYGRPLEPEKPEKPEKEGGVVPPKKE